MSSVLTPVGAGPQPGAPPAAKTSDAVSTRPRRRVVPFIILGLIAVALILWKTVFSHPTPPSNIVSLSGRIEADDSAVACKTSGRISEITVREGDPVKAGQIIARLDDDQIRAREQQSEAALRQAAAQVQQAHDAIAVLEQQLRQNELAVTQSQTDSEGRVRQAEADLSVAEAQEAQAQASLQLRGVHRGRLQRAGAKRRSLRSPGQGKGESRRGSESCSSRSSPSSRSRSRPSQDGSGDSLQSADSDCSSSDRPGSNNPAEVVTRRSAGGRGPCPRQSR